MIIYFLRHANAGEKRLDPVKDDKRPLDKLGIEQSHDVGRALAALDVTVDVILCSPLRRATQTAAVISNELGYEEKIVLEDALRPQAGYEQFRDLLRRNSRKDAIMVIGHNPSMTEFLNRMLLNGGSQQPIELKKGAVAKVERERRNSATLRWSFPPKVVRSIQESSAKSSRPKTVRK